MARVPASSLFGIHHKKLDVRSYVVLLLLCAAFFLPGLASLPPTDRDESWFAQATKQMVETGDYVDIKFLGIPRYKKPVGIYWAQAASVRLLNPDHLNEIWAYRVPSVIGAALAVLLTAALAALLFGGRTGMIAGIMMAACLDLGIEAHLAKTDAALLAAVMAVQYALARAYLLPPSGWKNALFFWTSLGIGILIKGPIILLTLVSTLVWLRVSDKNLTWFSRLHPWPGFFYALLFVAPWFVAINLASHGQFAAQAGGHDFLGKLFRGQDRGFLPPGLHTLIFPAMFFPFSLFALLAIPDVWKNRKQRRIRFCLGWIVPTWIVFELSFTKLPHYVLPVYPAIAVLTAHFLLKGFPALRASGNRWLPVLAVCLWLVIGAVFAIAFAVLPLLVDHKVDVLQIAVSLGFLVLQAAGLLFFLQDRKLPSAIALTAGMLVFSLTTFASTLPGLQRVWLARAIVRDAEAIKPCSHLKLVSAGYQEPSLAFLAGTDTKLVPNAYFAAAEMQHDACRVGVINHTLLKEFLGSFANAEAQPYPIGEPIEGLNNGNGSGTKVYFYLMPQTQASKPGAP